VGNLVLKGHISYATKRKYKWVAEFGKNTCEKCAALHGQEFEEDDVPYWPHPNCRCKVEEISIVDEIDAELDEYKEEIEQLKLQANELLGDTRVLRKQIEKLIKEAHSKEANSLEGRLTRLEYEIYKLIDKIKSLNREDINKHVLERIEKEIENIKKHMNKIKSNIEYKIVKNITKKETVIGGKIYSSIADMPESYNLLKIGLNIENYNEKYIQKNGKLYSSIDSLNNYKIQKDIRDRINKEMKIKDCKVLVLNTDSSISNKIIRSNAFKNFLDKNYEQLKTNKKIKDTEIEFESIDKDLYSTFHGAEIKNISVDDQGNLNLRIEDFYNFNPGRTSVKGRIGEKHQNRGELGPYYIITVLKIPKEQWQK